MRLWPHAKRITSDADLHQWLDIVDFKLETGEAKQNFQECMETSVPEEDGLDEEQLALIRIKVKYILSHQNVPEG